MSKGERLIPAIISKANNPAEILKSRARALARRDNHSLADEKMIEIIEFRLAKERFAIEQTYAREIQPLDELTPLPCTPQFLLGIVNVRGQILPVIDIKRFFDLPNTGITDLHQVLIVRMEDMEVGILVDSVAGVRRVCVSEVQSTAPTLFGIHGNYLKGITDQNLVILDLARVLRDPKLMIDEQDDALDNSQKATFTSTRLD